MAKKIFKLLSIGLFFLVIFSLHSVFAKNDKHQDIPEIDGIYDVPGMPGMKVRVFVHREKTAKPGKPAPAEPSEVCLNNDVDSDAVVSAAGWHLPSGYSYNLNLNNLPSLISRENWQTIAVNSFGVWDEKTDKVAISRGKDTTVNRRGYDGKNIVAWGRISSSALGVTYIWYYPATGQVAELDTILNQKYLWTWSGGNANCSYFNSYDAQAILTHEIGHWFGLDDHYTEEYFYNTMYGYGHKADAKAVTLTNGDISGLEAIYNK